ncbi:hypothetical protein ABLE93_09300 [Xanthobacter sp. KR7-65]|uniref:hypothetical protein n=1 Tax=Xanthobacter sp. KR7-65 TaxID=3156612 RepID=UPI0032B618B3
MRLLHLLLAGVVLAGSASAAGAQTMSYAQAGALLAKSCGPDIGRFCSNVNLGGGALVGCMNQKLSQVSEACKRDYAIATASIAKRDAAQDSIAEVCSADTARLCPGMIPQDGNLLSCLLQATKVVSAACNQAITDAGYR